MSSDAARLLPAAALTAAVGLPVRVFTVFEIRGGVGLQRRRTLDATVLFGIQNLERDCKEYQSLSFVDRVKGKTGKYSTLA